MWKPVGVDSPKVDRDCEMQEVAEFPGFEQTSHPPILAARLSSCSLEAWARSNRDVQSG